jgi:hypothetical protein
MLINIDTTMTVARLETALRIAGIVLDPTPSPHGIYHARVGKPTCSRCGRDAAAWLGDELLCADHWLEGRKC